MTSTIRLHKGDISAADAARYSGAIAIDTETLGLIRAATGSASCNCRRATAPLM